MVWCRNCRENTHTRQTVQKLASTKLHVDQEIYKEARNSLKFNSKKEESILWGKAKGKHGKS